MKDAIFTNNNGPFRISEILKKTLPSQKLPGNIEDKLIEGVSTIRNATSNDITYLSNKNYLNGVRTIRAAACLITMDLIDVLPENVLPIVVENPEYTIIDIINLFYKDLDDGIDSQICDLSYVAIDVVLGENAQIKPGAVLKSGVVIGDNTTVDSNTTIGSNVMIGHNGRISSNCTLQNCI
jgi:UDP-3-O-[3-hydroxymyristoyl] glucosamine N-acyltransferase